MTRKEPADAMEDPSGISADKTVLSTADIRRMNGWRRLRCGYPIE